MTIEAKLKLKRLFARSLGWATRAPGRLRILTYHSVQHHANHVLHQPPALFEQQMAFLARQGYRTVRLSDVARGWPAVLDESPIVALTFDDGVKNHCTTVCPILRRHGMVATFFVPTAHIHPGKGAKPAPAMAEYEGVHMCSWEDLGDMAQAGFEIGAHAHHHVRVAQLSRAEARAEVTAARTLLQQRLGIEATSFSYPKGHTDAFASWTRDLLADAGYTAACTQMGGRLHADSDLLALPRLSIDGLDTLNTFVMKLRGDYDCLRWIRRR